MRRIPVVLLLLALACSLSAESMRLQNLDLSVTADRANNYRLEEQLDFFYETPHHGFYQTIPTSFGRKKTHVQAIASSDPASVESYSDGVTIQVGDADTLVQGPKSYKLEWTYLVGDDLNRDYDEVYLNLVGNEWECPIDHVRFTLTLPKEARGAQGWLYAGYEGESQELPLKQSDDGTVWTGEAEGLGNGIGLTIQIQLPEGYFDEMVFERDWSAILLPVALAIGLVLLVVSLVLWRRWGRDDPVVPVVDWHEPMGLHPLEVGYVVDGSVEGKDLASMLFYWADQGYLTIKATENGRFVYTKQKDLVTDRPFEKEFFDGLFALGENGSVSSASLDSERFANLCRKVVAGLRRSFHGRRALKDERAENVKLLLQAFSAVLVVFASIATSISYLGGSLVFLVAIGLFCELVVGLQVGRMADVSLEKTARKAARIIPLLIIGLFSLLFTSVVAWAVVGLNGWETLASLVAVVVLPSLVSATAAVSAKKSAYAVKLWGAVLGLREFIEKVELDKLKLLGKDNPELFWKVLSYAMVLNLENTWARKFQRLGQSPRQPGWYDGPTVGDYLFYSSFARSMTRPVSRGIHYQAPPKAAPHAPVHSSFGGGGFSGGGYGGGGGGGW